MKFGKLAGRLYLIWSGSWFVGTFLVLFPFYWLFINLKTKHLTVILTKIWSIVFFPVSLLRVLRVYRFKPKAGEVYVYVSNHNSYLDIPVLTWVLPGFICFIGKASLGKVPVFGYMFRNLHITVNRKDRHDRAKSIKDGLDKLSEGRPLVVFPEGATNSEPMPSLMSFKDGAFRMAVEKQVPIVPVSIPYNGYILPDDGSFLARFHPTLVVVHEPITTKGLGLDDVENLKLQAWNTIFAELKYRTEHKPPLIPPLNYAN